MDLLNHASDYKKLNIRLTEYKYIVIKKNKIRKQYVMVHKNKYENIHSIKYWSRPSDIC